MFVAIDNKDMDALKVEEWINTNRDANGGVISPEFAMEVLGKTNHFAHIKKVINLIKKNCSDENGELVKDKVLAYREFILSAVDRREESPQAMKVLQDLAEKGGFVNEFDKVNGKTKIYELKDCENADVKIIKTKKELEYLKGEELEYLEGEELEAFEGEELEALEGEDLRVFFDADKVDLKDCDLEGVEKITFREGAEVVLCWVENLPKELDLSMCSKVDLSGCNLEGVEKITFREGAVVDLYVATELPKELDVSMCSKVSLKDCDLEDLELKFREGAVVDLKGAMNLPKELDFSMCSKVTLSECYLGGVERIKFRDKAQEKEFMDGARGFRGKVEYVGYKGVNMVNGNGGKDM